jgi:hypothetical protein
MRTEDTLISRIKKVQHDIQEIKVKQFSGSSNVKGVTFDSGIWDINKTVSGNTSNIVLVFLADNQQAPFATFHPIIAVNDVVQDNSNQNIQVNFFDGYDLSFFDFSTLPFSIVQDRVAIETLSVANTSTGYNLKVQLRGIATDTGQFGVIAT